MIKPMKQMSLDVSGFERKTKRTRKREFLDGRIWWCRGLSWWR